MPTTNKKTEDQKFNETLKRMLETPPKPQKGKRGHDDDGKKSEDQ